MGRWTPDEHGCIYDEAGCFARLTPNKAERLASRHNADIDALPAERDRVKTESLRVVVAGEACELFDLPIESAAFTHDGDLYIYEGMTTDWLSFNVTKLRWIQLDASAIVQPVRLERWEEE